MVDLKDIRAGDKVTIEGVVERVDDSDIPIHVRFPNNFSTWCLASDIATHTPRGLQPGDRVRHDWCESMGTVRYVEGAIAAWTPDGDDLTVTCCKYLTRLSD